MKIQKHLKKHPSGQQKAAFTLVEMMVAVAVFLAIFVGVMVGLQVFGLKVYTLSATKLVATADARKSLNALRTQIRSSKLVYVGNFTNGNFIRIPNGQAQTGNALQIFPSDTNNQPSQIPVIYFQNPARTNLCSSSNGMVQVLANFVTNNYVFTAEDYRANTMSNYDNNPVIRVTMQFYQWEYPIGVIGTNALNAYNHYRLQTRISRRLKE